MNISNIIFFAVFGQVRAVCLDGFSDHCIFVCLPTIITTTKEEGFCVEIFLKMPSPWSWSRKREGHSKQKKEYLQKKNVFQMIH